MSDNSGVFPQNVEFYKEAIEDLLRLDGSVRKKVIKQINKVAKKPLPREQGGYGIPLGNKGGNNLTGFLEIKLRDDGIRCIYKCVDRDDEIGMRIIIVSARTDEQVYKEASRRIL